MRRLALILVVLICGTASVAINAWSAITDLRLSKVWRVTGVDADHAVLKGVELKPDIIRAAIFPARPDRAVVYLRLRLKGDPATMREWLSCDANLTDKDGHVWSPLFGALQQEVVMFLAEDEKADQSCGQALTDEPDEGGYVSSDQVYLVPVDRLDQLHLQVSGLRTLPDAISMKVTPVLRPVE